MVGRQLMQLLDAEAVANHPLIGDDVGGAFAAVEQGHLSESEAGADRGHALAPFAFAVNLDLDADRAARQHEEQLGWVAFAHDDVAFVEHERPDDGFNQPAFLGGQALEQIDLRHRELRADARAGAGQELILAPLQSRIRVAELAQTVAFLRLGERPGQPLQRPVGGDRSEHQLRVAFRHGAHRPHDQLARRRIGQVHALEIDDDVS
ncbi:hypothetical protein AUC71_16165 [Methyloceanibacter marginalis]|uniref:Uncharacterized protein n=1 Tax=Methyloceanibacter marginalis TaxID=1774971 RepID=A0A1E3WB06_9HYPH|nr:hypothetical protein AUC71_16165 [Methyloceanibacter marginalis]